MTANQRKISVTTVVWDLIRLQLSLNTVRSLRVWRAVNGKRADSLPKKGNRLLVINFKNYTIYWLLPQCNSHIVLYTFIICDFILLPPKILNKNPKHHLETCACFIPAVQCWCHGVSSALTWQHWVWQVWLWSCHNQRRLNKQESPFIWRFCKTSDYIHWQIFFFLQSLPQFSLSAISMQGSYAADKVWERLQLGLIHITSGFSLFTMAPSTF